MTKMNVAIGAQSAWLNMRTLLVNDFTKEELKIILEAFDWIEGERSTPWSPEIERKIQSMIDNYDKPCEHIPCLAGRMTTTRGSVSVVVCVKCGELI